MGAGGGAAGEGDGAVQWNDVETGECKNHFPIEDYRFYIVILEERPNVTSK